MHVDTTELVVISCESTGRYTDCQQVLTARNEACASAASGCAAHPGLQAVWVLRHVLQCCIPAAACRYPV